MVLSLQFSKLNVKLDSEIKTIAYILGDGNFTTSNYGLGFANIDPVIIDDFNTALSTMQCYLNQKSYKDFSIVKNKNLPSGSYKSPAKVLLRDLGLHGKKSPQKDIPKEIFSLSNKQLAIFISRIWACDGHIDVPNKAIIYSSSSLKLIKQLQFLLLKFGVVSRWAQKRQPPHVLYKLVVQGEKNIRIFGSEIGIVGEKNKKLAQLINTKWKSKVVPFEEAMPYPVAATIKNATYQAGHTGQDISNLLGINRTSFPEFKPGRRRISRDNLRDIAKLLNNDELSNMANDEVYWTPIDSIDVIGKRKVYDLSIEGIPNFVANGVVVHNCRKLNGIISSSNTCMVWINQLRQKIGIVYGPNEVTTGGNALKFYASQRIDVRKGSKIEKNGVVVGHTLKVKIIKNKVAPPFRTCEVDLIYGQGFSMVGEILTMAIETGLIKKSGTWFSYEDENIGQGRDNTIEFLEAHPGMVDEIKIKLGL